MVFGGLTENDFDKPALMFAENQMQKLAAGITKGYCYFSVSLEILTMEVNSGKVMLADSRTRGKSAA